MAVPERSGATDLPRVAIVFDQNAFSALELKDAARDVCELVWITGWPGERRFEPQRLLARLGTHLDVTGCTEDEAASRIGDLGVSGIAAFCDAALEPAALIAERLGLPFHDRATAHRLRDKFAQRAALAAAGIDVPGTRLVQAASIRCLTDVQALDAQWPAVLKPRCGVGSVDTFLIENPQQLLDVLDRTAADTEFVLEDYLADRPRPREERENAAGMLSVELLVEDGRTDPIALTGRFPLKSPFRESGSFLPSDVGEEDAAAAIRNARDAAAALGVDRGVLHIEQKLTPAGPRIIEVNGRVGGLVPTLLRRLGGPAILTLAFKAALGVRIDPLPAPPPSDGPVAFYHAWLPPMGEFRLTSVAGFDDVAARPEVDHAWLEVEPGTVVDSRVGGGVTGYVAALFGAASSHSALWSLRGELEAALSVTFTAVQRELASCDS